MAAKKTAKKTARKAPRKTARKAPAARKTARKSTAPRVRAHRPSPRGGPKCKSCEKLHSKRQHWSHAEGPAQEHSFKKARTKKASKKRPLGLQRPERGRQAGGVRFSRKKTSQKGAVRRARARAAE